LKLKRIVVVSDNNNDRNLLMLDMCFKRGSGGRNALVILEGKIKGKKQKSRPKIMMRDYREVK